MATHFSHRGICVQDIDVSTRFYGDVFQFSPTEEFGYLEGEWLEKVTDIKDVNVRPMYLRNPQGISLDFMHFKRPGAFGPRERRAVNQYGLTHLAFFVADLDATP